MKKSDLTPLVGTDTLFKVNFNGTRCAKLVALNAARHDDFTGMNAKPFLRCEPGKGPLHIMSIDFDGSWKERAVNSRDILSLWETP